VTSNRAAPGILTSGMPLVALCLTLFAVFCAAWYWLALRHSRRRALQVLRWIESALGGQGQPTGVRWIARSRFKVPLRLNCGVFHRASVLVDLFPRQMPLRWLLGRLNGQREVLIFQADLDLPPAFTLHVHNYRWFARSGRTARTQEANWEFEHTGPFVISTRMSWQKEISCAMSALAREDHREFLDISFQRRSPHFSATLPLEAIAPTSSSRPCMLETMRELAASSSARLS
jgi:hypothetical protein